jgi:hypothetical protein
VTLSAQPKDLIARLTTRVDSLEVRLQNAELLIQQLATGKVVQLSPEVMEYIVNITGAHMQNLFQNDVTVDSLVHRLFVAGANAIAFKAQASKNRAPQLVAIKQYIPGSLRAQLNEAGDVILEEQVKDAADAESGWEPAARLLTSEGHVEVFRVLLQQQGVAAGEVRYIIDEVTLEASRDQIARDLAARNTPAQEPEAAEAGDMVGQAPEDENLTIDLDPADAAPAETLAVAQKAFNETAPVSESSVAEQPSAESPVKQDL